MSFAQEKYYTMEDIHNLPEGTRAELTDGRIYYMAPPSTKHQRILSRLHIAIGKYIDSTGGLCEVFPGPFAVFLNEEKKEHDTTYFEPDISVICDPGKIDDKGCHGAPDWIIEIVSPSSLSHDYVLKLNKYMTAGVREYWIVNPMKQTIYVYRLEEMNFETTSYTFQDKIQVGIYDDFTIDFGEIVR